MDEQGLPQVSCEEVFELMSLLMESGESTINEHNKRTLCLLMEASVKRISDLKSNR